ncbi:MAG: outer membrane beta-barrel protein [Helicobacter sp.]|nr:outer membrane beta-barrel protein [Helicobacter sp.]
MKAKTKAKSKFLALAASFFGIFGIANAGFFVGAGGEVSGDNQNAVDISTSGIGLGLILGNEFFANDYLGARASLNFGYEGFKSKNKAQKGVFKKFDIGKPSGNGFNAGIAADLLVNLYNDKTNSIGIFGGAGVNYSRFTLKHQTLTEQQVKNLRISSVNYDARVGLSFLTNKHRIDLFVSSPLYEDKRTLDLDSKTITRERGTQDYETEKIALNYYYLF